MAFYILLRMYVCMYACIYVAPWLSWKIGKQRSTWVYGLTARLLWKPFRPPEQHLHWYNSAKSRWMFSPPSIL